MNKVGSLIYDGMNSGLKIKYLFADSSETNPSPAFALRQTVSEGVKG